MRRWRESDNDSAREIIFNLIVLYALVMLYLWLMDRTAFWHWFSYTMVIAILVLGGIVWWKKFQEEKKGKQIDKLLAMLKENGLEEYVKNFIDRFGVQKGKKSDWMYRGYSFDWERLSDFRKVLNERGMRLPLDDFKDTSFLLRHYIQQREERLTRDTVSIIPRKFSELSGSEFEVLLYRLFGAMGYSVQKTGKTGDQGGDLVVNMGQQRVLVQAKCYKDFSIGNAAVQEAVAAEKFYDCNKAWVVASSNFTREAVELAKANNVDLVGKEKLSELLMQYLKENWG